MAKICSKCNKKLNLLTAYKYKDKIVCFDCWRLLEQEDLTKQKEKKLEEIIAKAPEIQCPFCKKWFKKITDEQYKYSLEGNIVRGIIFVPWGVVKAIKNRPYIECPHCKMKIMQG